MKPLCLIWRIIYGFNIKRKGFQGKALKNLDLSPYSNKNVLTCTADAIIPMWAYMLVSSYLQPIAKNVVFGNAKFLHQTLFLKNIAAINPENYTDKEWWIKGCGDLPVSEKCLCGHNPIIKACCKKHYVWRTLQHCAYL